MMAKTWTFQSRANQDRWTFAFPTILMCMAVLSSNACAGVIILENSPLGTWVQTDSKNAVFNHQIADHSQDSFLATQRDGQANGNNAPVGSSIDAFNGIAADGSNPDAFFNGNKTRPIQLSEIPLTSNGTFRVFLLDVNQVQSNEVTDHILIDMLEVYLSKDASIKDLGVLTSTPANTTAMVYDMATDTYEGSPTPITVQIDGDNGNGKADMLFYVRNSLFVNAYNSHLSSPSDPPGFIDNLTVYLRYRYTNFNDGAEEWHVTKGTYLDPTVVPEPAAMALWAVGGSMGMIWNRRRKRAKSA